MWGRVENLSGRTYVSLRSQYWKVCVIMMPAVRSFHRPHNFLDSNYTLEYIHIIYMHLLSLVDQQLQLAFEENHISSTKMNTLKPN